MFKLTGIKLTNKSACKAFLAFLEKEQPGIKWQDGQKPTGFVPPLEKYPLFINLDNVTKRIYYCRII